MPQTIKTAEEFKEITNGTNLSVVHFSANWSEQCKLINDVLDELSKISDYSAVKLCSCEAEDLAEVSLKYKIEAAPTLVLFKAGREVDRVNGADAAQLTDKIKKHHAGPQGKAPLEERLKQLINRHKVMIFMKGDRTAPRCGFSKQLIHIMNGLGVEYDTFDILQDEEVRQGLKTYSDWPTYPQLYVKGDLVGGLDIIKELQASGELDTTLKG